MSTKMTKERIRKLLEAPENQPHCCHICGAENATFRPMMYTRLEGAKGVYRCEQCHEHTTAILTKAVFGEEI